MLALTKSVRHIGIDVDLPQDVVAAPDQHHQFRFGKHIAGQVIPDHADVRDVLVLLHGNDLELEAYAGRETEHTRIPVGKGVCGTAVAEQRDQNVADGNVIGNYLACNVFTKSELVVLIRRGDHILGQIDIDSDVTNGFGER